MSQFINSIKSVKENYRPYDAWEQKQADTKARKEYLAKILVLSQDEIHRTKKKAQVVIRATEILDKRSDDNTGSMGIAVNAASLAIFSGVPIAMTKFIKMMAKKSNAHKIGAQIASFSIFLASSIGFIVWGNSKQKEAARIGRFQAKKEDLKDIKNFVVFLPQQAKKAHEIADLQPTDKEKHPLWRCFDDLKDLAKDKKAYEDWVAQKDPHEIGKLKATNFTAEELKNGEKDKELIVNVVKDLNIQAEEYSENTANLFDTISSASFLAAVPLGIATNQLLNKLPKIPKLTKYVVSALIPIGVSLGVDLAGAMAKREASRIGRYKARQDLLKNPASLMTFGEKDMEYAQLVHGQTQNNTIWQTIKHNFKFFPTYLKDRKEYNNYQKNEYIAQEKLIKALHKGDISEKQLITAKNLQKKVFTAFDQIDEMALLYSEDVEAATGIAKASINVLWTLGTTLCAGALGLMASKGKIPVTKIINKTANKVLNEQSPIKKSINKINSILEKDSELKKRVNSHLVNLEFSEIKNLYKLKDKCTNISTELDKIIEPIKNGVFNERYEKGISEHFKPKGLISKYAQKLTSQGIKLWMKDNIVPTSNQKDFVNMTKSSYKNYSTLINSTVLAGIPLLGAILGVPFITGAILTNIQKKAGKIGIMKAMEELDDAKVFSTKKSSANENIFKKQFNSTEKYIK